MHSVTRTIFPVFAFKVMHSDTVNSVLQTINQGRNTVWGASASVARRLCKSVRWFVTHALFLHTPCKKSPARDQIYSSHRPSSTQTNSNSSRDIISRRALIASDWQSVLKKKNSTSHKSAFIATSQKQYHVSFNSIEYPTHCLNQLLPPTRNIHHNPTYYSYVTEDIHVYCQVVPFNATKIPL